MSGNESFKPELTEYCDGRESIVSSLCEELKTLRAPYYDNDGVLVKGCYHPTYIPITYEQWCNELVTALNVRAGFVRYETNHRGTDCAVRLVRAQWPGADGDITTMEAADNE